MEEYYQNRYGMFFRTKEKYNDIWDDLSKMTNEKIYKKKYYSNSTFMIETENNNLYQGIMVASGTAMLGNRFQGCYYEKGINEHYLLSVIYPCLYYSNNKEEMLFIVELV